MLFSHSKYHGLWARITGRLIASLGIVTAALLATTAPAHAAPTLTETPCPEFLRTDGSNDTTDVAKGLKSASSYIPTAVDGGDFYCTVERRKGGGMFTLGAAYALLHERGTIDGTAYRIDYHRSWAEVYVGDAAKAVRTEAKTEKVSPPHSICRYTVDNGNFIEADHAVTSAIQCAIFPSDTFKLIFYVAPGQYGLWANENLIIGIGGSIPATDVIDGVETDRADGLMGSFGDLLVTMPGMDTQLRVQTESKRTSIFTSGMQYELAFKPLRSLGLDRIQGDPRDIYISRSVGRLISAFEDQDYFLIGRAVSAKGQFIRVPTARTNHAMKLLAPLAKQMHSAVQ